ncbi:hypothetical protein L3Q82_009034, partial [Scortum barcoo]
MCGESGVWRERERFASPVWQSRSGSVPVWALCPRGGSVWLALTVAHRQHEMENMGWRAATHGESISVRLRGENTDRARLESAEAEELSGPLDLAFAGREKPQPGGQELKDTGRRRKGGQQGGTLNLVQEPALQLEVLILRSEVKNLQTAQKLERQRTAPAG